MLTKKHSERLSKNTNMNRDRCRRRSRRLPKNWNSLKSATYNRLSHCPKHLRRLTKARKRLLKRLLKRLAVLAPHTRPAPSLTWSPKSASLLLKRNQCQLNPPSSKRLLIVVMVPSRATLELMGLRSNRALWAMCLMVLVDTFQQMDRLDHCKLPMTLVLIRPITIIPPVIVTLNTPNTLITLNHPSYPMHTGLVYPCRLAMASIMTTTIPMVSIAPPPHLMGPTHPIDMGSQLPMDRIWRLVSNLVLCMKALQGRRIHNGLRSTPTPAVAHIRTRSAIWLTKVHRTNKPYLINTRPLLYLLAHLRRSRRNRRSRHLRAPPRLVTYNPCIRASRHR